MSLETSCGTVSDAPHPSCTQPTHMGPRNCRLRGFGISRADAEGRISEFRSAWYRRMDDLARSKLTDSQFH